MLATRWLPVLAALALLRAAVDPVRAECAKCTNQIGKGKRMLVNDADMFNSPCNKWKNRTMPKCQPFKITGWRPSGECYGVSDGNCYIEVETGPGTGLYLVFKTCGAEDSTSNVVLTNSSRCAQPLSPPLVTLATPPPSPVTGALTPPLPVTGSSSGSSTGDDGGGSNTAAIVGGVMGGCVAAAAALLAWWWRRRKAQRADSQLPIVLSSGPDGKPSKHDWSPMQQKGGELDEDKSPPGSVGRQLQEDAVLVLLLSKLGPGDQPEGGLASNGSSNQWGTGSLTSSGLPSVGTPGTPSGDGGALQRHPMPPASLDVNVKSWALSFRDLQLEAPCGEGSFGRVYLASWRGTPVAVKILLNTGLALHDVDAATEMALSLSNPVLQSLQQEAGLMAVLRHPNIVSFLGVCPVPPCVVTEYCSRGSLSDVLRAARQSPSKAARLDWSRRLNMALDAARGMLYLHAHDPPIMHRDLKSPNLLVDQHWRVKVSDFNLSKIMGESEIASSVAATNPRWLAPEILDGKGATFASDVYAYGIVLWELMTWQLPWGATNQFQLIKDIMAGGRPRVPASEQLPDRGGGFAGLDAYVALMQDCWAQDQQRRPTFAEVIERLRELLALASGRSMRATAAAAPAAPAPERASAESLGTQPTGGSSSQTYDAAGVATVRGSVAEGGGGSCRDLSSDPPPSQAS